MDGAALAARELSPLLHFAAFSLAMFSVRLLGDAATRRLRAARVVRGGGLLAAAGLGLAIAAVASVGYTCLLAGPPLIGLVAHLASVRIGLGLVVLASLPVASLASSVNPIEVTRA
jgi:hypothetical protein